MYQKFSTYILTVIRWYQITHNFILIKLMIFIPNFKTAQKIKKKKIGAKFLIQNKCLLHICRNKFYRNIFLTHFRPEVIYNQWLIFLCWIVLFGLYDDICFKLCWRKCLHKLYYKYSMYRNAANKFFSDLQDNLKN